ncbi:MAG: amino acid ABC transporter permease, partial [Rhodoferax sp.]|nr:amino acid ABC transporter permease [Rhodoferax sp.]
MTAQVFQAIAPRPAPVKVEGFVAWIRTNLFGDLRTSLGTLAIGAVLLWIVPPLIQWLFINAIWIKDYQACHNGSGACWGVIAEKYRIII